MNKNKISTLLFWSLALTMQAQPGDIPGAQPGKCYAKCLVHDKFETVTENLVQKPASVELKVIPAEFETVTAHYVAKESYTRLVAIPAVFENRTEKILVAPAGYKANPTAYESVREPVLIKPATKYYEISAAQFETVNEPVVVEAAYMELEALPRQFESVFERVVVRPAMTKWVRKKVDRECLSANPDDCFVWCMVEIPAQYQSIYREEDRGCDGRGSNDCELYQPIDAKTKDLPVQKVAVPASARELIAPAVYDTITKWVLKSSVTAPAANDQGEYVTVTKQVLKSAAQVREEIVPAEYKTIRRKVVKKQASFKAESTPEVFATITKRVLVRKGGFSEWREIICGEKMTGYTVRQIQEALRAMGYYQGVIDGNMGTGTKTAIAQFQEERDLPADGNVDFETLKALGIGH